MMEYLEKEANITGLHYADQIRKLEAIKENRRGKLRVWVLVHQENAPAHKATIAITAIRETGFKLLEHPPYSPDLVLSKFYFFSQLKEHLQGDYVEK
ncbi:unnamed protein product [Euphydryas editha]|uniref:Histone-lysine N-methyltransferase SETMAR n=1 Tax=Euphydryas editha TaxID=104508 RepID=A0AAU9V0G9_EUPED|nr:unnamed protein product [Euphydryas editha]